MTSYTVSAILPTYNEKDNIGRLVKEISRQTEPPPEVIVVDDNSPDRTWEIVYGMQKDMPNVRLEKRVSERGLATALIRGIELATGDVLVWMDCDFSHPPELIPEMLKALNDADVVIASRYVKGGTQEYPFIRDLTSRAFNLYASIFLSFKVRDWTSGFAMVKRGVLDKVRINPLGQGYGEYFVGMLYSTLVHGFRVKEIPYRCVYNDDHESKTSTSIPRLLQFGLSYGMCVPELKWQALRGKL